MTARVAVVTDSTASLPPGITDGVPLFQVPLQVVIDGYSQPESGDAAVARAVADALRNQRCVTTSKPNPDVFHGIYQGLFTDGFDHIVSVHLSSAISGTYDSALGAARDFGDRIQVIDSRTVAMGCGFPALAGAQLALDQSEAENSQQEPVSVENGGVTADLVAEMIRDRSGRTETYFAVNSLDYLRRGGRIGAAAAMLGTSLAIKPLLRVADGVIVPYERVRTTARAHARLVELAVAAVDRAGGCADVAVHHVDDATAADRLAATLRDRIEPSRLVVSAVSAALGGHTGPGTVGVVISPH